MNCGNCGGPMHVVSGRDYYVCEYCTAHHFRKESPDGVRLLDESTDLLCPECGETLVVGELGGTDLLKCKKCEGILLYQTDLLSVLRQRMAEVTAPPKKKERLDPAELERRLRCPMCEGALDVHPYYGPGRVIIDTCPECQVIWLDRGEMDTIARASVFETKR